MSPTPILPPIDGWWFGIVLAAIIVATGLIGGWTGYLQTQHLESDSSVLASLLGGITAAAIVPLFLQTISSRLLSDASRDSFYLFAFAGFCLVAAYSSRWFLRSISAKVLQEVREEVQASKQEVQAQVAAVDRKVDEVREDAGIEADGAMLPAAAHAASPPTGPEPSSGASTSDKSGNSPSEVLDSASLAVLKTLVAGRYRIRTLGGVADETGLPRTEVSKILVDLINRGLATETKNGKFFATADGMRAWFAGSTP